MVALPFSSGVICDPEKSTFSPDAEDTSPVLDEDSSPDTEPSSPEAEESPPTLAVLSSPEVEDPSPLLAELSSPEEADSVPDSEDSSPEVADCPSDSLEVTSLAELEGSSVLDEYLPGSKPGINGSRPSSSEAIASSEPSEGDTVLEQAKSPKEILRAVTGSRIFVNCIEPPNNGSIQHIFL